MRFVIFGAGAIGGYLGAKLALAGEDVTLIARGEHLRAMQANGLRLIERGAEMLVRPRCTSDPREAGAHDYLILALKAHQVTGALEQIAALPGPPAPVVTAQNGLPWWYFYKHGNALEGTRIESVDPGGRIWETVGPDRAIGCVVYPACEVVEPGAIRHIEGERFTLGEPDGTRSERVVALSRALTGAGLKAPMRSNIRNEIWLKLWGNVAFNPMSALTRATLEEMCRDAFTRAFARAVMLEVQEVARALGEEMPLDVESRIRGAESVGSHKTSTLQDLEAGRAMELDAMVGAVVELARLTGTPTPSLDGLYGMARLLARRLGLA
jgi:2-dehydropantoate 2-reductase